LSLRATGHLRLLWPSRNLGSLRRCSVAPAAVGAFASLALGATIRAWQEHTIVAAERNPGRDEPSGVFRWRGQVSYGEATFSTPFGYGWRRHLLASTTRASGLDIGSQDADVSSAHGVGGQAAALGCTAEFPDRRLGKSAVGPAHRVGAPTRVDSLPARDSARNPVRVEKYSK